MLINQDFSPDRTKYIGGSDIGAILGLSRFRSPLEVWMEKTGKAVKQLDSLPLRFGSFAEEFVASEYSRSTGFELVHDECGQSLALDIFGHDERKITFDRLEIRQHQFGFHACWTYLGRQ